MRISSDIKKIFNNVFSHRNTQEETVTEEAGLSPKSGECRTQNNQPIAAASAVANSSDSDKTNVNTLPLPNVTQSRSRQERPFTTPRSIRRPLVGQMISPTRNESISNPNESILIQAQTPNRPEPIHVHKEAQATDEVAYDESFSELQLDDITLDQIPSDALISNQSVRPQVEATNNVTTTTTQNNTTSHSSIIDTHATISNDMISIKQTSEEEFDTNCSTPEIDQEMYERLTGSQQTAPPNLTLTNPGNRTTTHHSIITTQSRHPPLSADVQSELASIINSEFDEDFDEDDTPSHMNPTPLTCLSAGTSTQLSNQAPAPPVSFQIYQDTTMQTNDIDTSLANETNATNDLSTSEEPASLIMNSVTMRGPLDWFLTQPIVLCGSDDEDDPSLYDLNQFQQLLDENAQYLP